MPSSSCRCPNCGAQIYVNKENSLGLCEYCGTQTIEDKAAREQPASVRLLEYQDSGAWYSWYYKAKAQLTIPIKSLADYREVKEYIEKAAELAPAQAKEAVQQKLEPLRRYNEKRRRGHINFLVLAALFFGVAFLSFYNAKFFTWLFPLGIALFAYIYITFFIPKKNFKELEPGETEDDQTDDSLLNKIYSRSSLLIIIGIVLIGIIVYQIGWYTFNGWSRHEYNSVNLPNISYSFRGSGRWKYPAPESESRRIRLSQSCNCEVWFYEQKERELPESGRHFFIDGHKAAIMDFGSDQVLYIVLDENTVLLADTDFDYCRIHKPSDSYYKRFFNSFRIISH